MIIKLGHKHIEQLKLNTNLESQITQTEIHPQ